MDFSYKPLDKDDEELFQKYSKDIEEKVCEIFPSIPADFQLKPVTIQKIIGCGIFYDLRIALPDGQFAKVKFHSGGHMMVLPPGVKPPGPTFSVDPTPSASQYE